MSKFPIAQGGPAAGAAVAAADQSVAAGGDIIESPVTYNYGLDASAVGDSITDATGPLYVQLKSLTEQVAREKGVPPAPLLAILEKLGELGVAETEILARLEAKADELIALRVQLARPSNQRPEFAALRAKALDLIDKGEFDAAREVLARG